MAAAAPTVSRQARWIKRRALHTIRCVRCGRKRTELRRYCNDCADKRNKEKRIRYRKAKGRLRKKGLLK